ncbi:ribbon-helix-helix protein, CopG family [Nitrobacter vulgaris]|uniref:ribbon-helix-helix protein, CopG family n=1 Tax=Nitrobacter vulgaris TaxID=29421 RepID=UPI0035B535EE
MTHDRKRRVCDKKVTVRLPAMMLRRVDSLALYSVSPRATAIRRLLARGLEVEEATHGE